jgi:hypothetical protein
MANIATFWVSFRKTVSSAFKKTVNLQSTVSCNLWVHLTQNFLAKKLSSYYAVQKKFGEIYRKWKTKTWYITLKHLIVHCELLLSAFLNVCFRTTSWHTAWCCHRRLRHTYVEHTFVRAVLKIAETKTRLDRLNFKISIKLPGLSGDLVLQHSFMLSSMGSNLCTYIGVSV